MLISYQVEETVRCFAYFVKRNNFSPKEVTPSITGRWKKNTKSYCTPQPRLLPHFQKKWEFRCQASANSENCSNVADNIDFSGSLFTSNINTQKCFLPLLNKGGWGNLKSVEYLLLRHPLPKICHKLPIVGSCFRD